MIRNLCIARRLVEAGARVVTLNFSRWDWHGPDGKNFVESRDNMPLLDQGVSALVSDLHARGLDQDVSVVVWGEFGRTPRINNTEGRDHWPQVNCALLAGGGMKTGQVIGATDRLGGTPAQRPGQVPGSLRHALSQHRPQSQRDAHLRSQRPAAVSGRLGHRSDPRSALIGRRSEPREGPASEFAWLRQEVHRVSPGNTFGPAPRDPQKKRPHDSFGLKGCNISAQGIALGRAKQQKKPSPEWA